MSEQTVQDTAELVEACGIAGAVVDGLRAQGKLTAFWRLVAKCICAEADEMEVDCAVEGVDHETDGAIMYRRGCLGAYAKPGEDKKITFGRGRRRRGGQDGVANSRRAR
jgi:hypothetical protein